MPAKKIKIKEITVSLSGVIPVAAYENLRPGFSITVEPNGQDPKKIFDNCRQYLHEIFELEANRAKAELIDKQYANIRFYDRNGLKYPSVTSILFFDKDFHVTDDQLRQYASRGNVVEALIQRFIETGEWPDPLQIEAIREDVSILLTGSLNFTWDDCSHKAFMEEFGKNLKVETFQQTLYNDQNQYAGTADIVGEYDGKRSLIDIKTGGFDMRQLAAYAVCLEGIEQLVVFPVGPTDNKCGYKKPVICDTIQSEFAEFLKARAKFRQRFGV